MSKPTGSPWAARLPEPSGAAAPASSRRRCPLLELLCSFLLRRRLLQGGTLLPVPAHRPVLCMAELRAVASLQGRTLDGRKFKTAACKPHCCCLS